jgi:ribosomal protein S18 acetylase RimI-like enzyme
MNLTIRPATPDEASSLTALALAAKAHWGYPAAWLEAWRSGLTITPEYIDSHAVLVAESPAVQPPILGVCSLEDRGDHWQIEHLWVDPRAHGSGIGKALVSSALAIAGRSHPGTIVCVQSDPHAAGFYRRLGAREVGAAPAPMEGEPARVLPLFEFDAPMDAHS